jgi:drug/metabolite transporter (DMT)-like permease
MEETLQMAIVFVSIIAVIKIISDNVVRKRLIDKGMVDEKIKYLYNGSPRSKALSNLKWGIVLIGIGLAAIIAQVSREDWVDRGGAIGLMFVFGGVGYLTYYFLMSREADKAKKEDDPTP